MNGTFRLEYGDGVEYVWTHQISTVGENHIIDIGPSPFVPRCKTCCWYDTGTYHQCVCPKMVYGYLNEGVDSDGLAIEDDEGWGMMPEPNFGCIHHEEK